MYTHRFCRNNSAYFGFVLSANIGVAYMHFAVFSIKLQTDFFLMLKALSVSEHSFLAHVYWLYLHNLKKASCI